MGSSYGHPTQEIGRKRRNPEQKAQILAMILKEKQTVLPQLMGTANIRGW